jgi:hypothetical protein
MTEKTRPSGGWATGACSWFTPGTRCTPPDMGRGTPKIPREVRAGRHPWATPTFPVGIVPGFPLYPGPVHRLVPIPRRVVTMPQRDATRASRVPAHRLIGQGRAQRGMSARYHFGIIAGWP